MSFGLQDESQTMNRPWGILPLGLFLKGEKDTKTSTCIQVANESQRGQVCKETFSPWTNKLTWYTGSISEGVGGGKRHARHSHKIPFLPKRNQNCRNGSFEVQGYSKRDWTARKLSEMIRVISKGLRNQLKKLTLATDSTI